MLAQWRAEFAAGKEDEAHAAFDAAYGSQLAQLNPRKSSLTWATVPSCYAGRASTFAVTADWWPNGWSRLSELRFLKLAICARTPSLTSFRGRNRNPERPGSIGCQLRRRRGEVLYW